MKKITKKILICSSLSLLFANMVVLADTALPPRVFLWGTTGQSSFGEGDAMIPLLSNCNQSFYTDLTSKYGKENSWLGSIGFGDRTVIYNSAIVGAYLFGEYNRTVNENYFPVLNPGLEWMNNYWDVHLNGYLPTGTESKLVSTLTATQAGMPDTVFFTGHSEFAPLYDLRENVGPGADFEVGRTFFPMNRTRFFAGGYLFDPKYNSNIKGIEAGFELPLYNQKVFADVRDSYDNYYHNTFTVSLRINFGGVYKGDCPDIHDRMLDLIPRHLGSLQDGDGIPSPTKIVSTGRRALIRDNIWFFIPGNGALTTIDGFEDGTFENPALGLGQSQLDSIDNLAPNGVLFFESGTYNNAQVGNGYSFHAGQTAEGRTNNFAQEASGGTRPIFNDTFILNGNNNVSDVQINGNTTSSIADGATTTSANTGVIIASGATGTINIDDASINTSSSVNSTVGILANSNNASVNISNSAIRSNLESTGMFNFGIDNLGLGILNIRTTSVNVTSSKSAAAAETVTNGILNNAAGTVNIANSVITASSSNSGVANTDRVVGIANNISGAVNLSNTQVSANAVNTGAGVGVSEFVTGFSNSSSAVNTIVNSTLSATGTTTGAGVSVIRGIVNEFGTVNLNNSSVVAQGINSIGTGDKDVSGFSNTDGTITATNSSIVASLLNGTPGGNVYGVFNRGGYVSISSSTINVTGNGGTAVGLHADAGGTIVLNDTVMSILNPGGTVTRTEVIGPSSITCYRNGSPVPC